MGRSLLSVTSIYVTDIPEKSVTYARFREISSSNRFFEYKKLAYAL